MNWVSIDSIELRLSYSAQKTKRASTRHWILSSSFGFISSCLWLIVLLSSFCYSSPQLLLSMVLPPIYCLYLVHLVSILDFISLIERLYSLCLSPCFSSNSSLISGSHISRKACFWAGGRSSKPGPHSDDECDLWCSYDSLPFMLMILISMLLTFGGGLSVTSLWSGLFEMREFCSPDSAIEWHRICVGSYVWIVWSLPTTCELYAAWEAFLFCCG